MSLINQMLQDLDKKRNIDNKEIPSSLSGLSLSSSKSKINKKNYKLLLCLLLIVIILLVLVLYFFISRNKLTNEHVLNVPKHTVSKGYKVVTSSSNDSSVTSSELKKVSVFETNNLIKISFELSGKALYRLSSLSKANDLKLILLHVPFSEVVLPKLKSKSIVTAISKKLINGNLQFKIHLVKGTKIDSLKLSNKSPYTLTLTLLKNKKIINNIATHKGVVSDNQVKKTAVLLSPAELLSKRYQVAINEISNGKRYKALQDLRSILQDVPSYVVARQALVIMLQRSGQLKEAMEEVNTGIMISPNNIGLLMLKAKILLNESNAKEALKVLQVISPPLSKNVEYYSLVANLYQRVGQYDMAAQFYEQLIKTDPANSIWWMGLAIAFESSNKLNLSLKAYQQAASTGSLSPSLQIFVMSKIKQLGGV
jgi:tetratricopeptide (TPR) repeat protein